MMLSPDVLDSGARQAHILLSFGLAALALWGMREKRAGALGLAVAFVADGVRLLLPDLNGSASPGLASAAVLAITAATVAFFVLLAIVGSTLPLNLRSAGITLAIAVIPVALFGAQIFGAGDFSEGEMFPLGDRIGYLICLAVEGAALGVGALRLWRAPTLHTESRMFGLAIVLMALATIAVDVTEMRSIGALLSWPHALFQALFVVGQGVFAGAWWRGGRLDHPKVML